MFHKINTNVGNSHIFFKKRALIVIGKISTNFHSAPHPKKKLLKLLPKGLNEFSNSGNIGKGRWRGDTRYHVKIPKITTLPGSRLHAVPLLSYYSIERGAKECAQGKMATKVLLRVFSAIFPLARSSASCSKRGCS